MSNTRIKGGFKTRKILEDFVRKEFFINGKSVNTIVKSIDISKSTIYAILYETTYDQRENLNKKLLNKLSNT